MKYWLLILVLVCGCPALSKAQPDSSAHGLGVMVGSSLTYIWDENPNYLQEYTWSLNAAFSPIRRLYLGINYMRIWSESRRLSDGRFQLAGVYAQWQLGNRRKVYLFPELGYYLGDYCTCHPTDPYRRAWLSYLSVGGGFGWRMYKGLELETSFLAYNILNRIAAGKYSYTQYVVGLNYAFKFRDRGKDWEGLGQDRGREKGSGQSGGASYNGGRLMEGVLGT